MGSSSYSALVWSKSIFAIATALHTIISRYMTSCSVNSMQKRIRDD